MAFKSGFFNAVDGDRMYNADDLSLFYYGLISNGVLASPASSLAVSAGTGMKVNVAAGRAMVNCKYFVNTENYELIVQAADDTNPRIDRVILRLDMTNRDISILIRTGTPAASPVAPELERSRIVYELSLAAIMVAAEAAAITQSMIVDEREDADACGFCAFPIEQEYAKDAGNGAIITHSVKDRISGLDVVEIRCHAITDVTPASASWGTGSFAWEISTGKMYGLDTDSTWTEVAT